MGFVFWFFQPFYLQPEFVEVFLIPKTFEGDKEYAQQMLYNGLSSHALNQGY